MASGGYDTKEEAREAAGGGGVKKISGKYVPVKSSSSSSSKSSDSSKSKQVVKVIPKSQAGAHEITITRAIPTPDISSPVPKSLPEGAKTLSGGRVKYKGLTYSKEDFNEMQARGQTVGVQKAADVQEREYQSAKGWFEEVEVEEERKYPLYEDKAAFLYTPIEYFPGEKFEDTGVKPVGTTKIPITEAFLEGPDILRVYPGGDAPGGPVDIITKEAKEAGRTVKREGDKLITRKPIYVTYKEEEQTVQEQLDSGGAIFQERGVYAPIESFFESDQAQAIKYGPSPFEVVNVPSAKDVFIVQGGKKVGLKPTTITYATDTGNIVKEEYTLPLAHAGYEEAVYTEMDPEGHADWIAYRKSVTQDLPLVDFIDGKRHVTRTVKGEAFTEAQLPYVDMVAQISRTDTRLDKAAGVWGKWEEPELGLSIPEWTLKTAAYPFQRLSVDTGKLATRGFFMGQYAFSGAGMMVTGKPQGTETLKAPFDFMRAHPFETGLAIASVAVPGIGGVAAKYVGGIGGKAISSVAQWGVPLAFGAGLTFEETQRGFSLPEAALRGFGTIGLAVAVAEGAELAYKDISKAGYKPSPYAVAKPGVRVRPRLKADWEGPLLEAGIEAKPVEFVRTPEAPVLFEYLKPYSKKAPPDIVFRDTAGVPLEAPKGIDVAKTPRIIDDLVIGDFAPTDIITGLKKPDLTFKSPLDVYTEGSTKIFELPEGFTSGPTPVSKTPRIIDELVIGDFFTSGDIITGLKKPDITFKPLSAYTEGTTRVYQLPEGFTVGAPPVARTTRTIDDLVIGDYSPTDIISGLTKPDVKIIPREGVGKIYNVDWYKPEVEIARPPLDEMYTFVADSFIKPPKVKAEPPSRILTDETFFDASDFVRVDKSKRPTGTSKNTQKIIDAMDLFKPTKDTKGPDVGQGTKQIYKVREVELPTTMVDTILKAQERGKTITLTETLTKPTAQQRTRIIPISLAMAQPQAKTIDQEIAAYTAAQSVRVSVFPKSAQKPKTDIVAIIGSATKPAAALGTAQPTLQSIFTPTVPVAKQPQAITPVQPQITPPFSITKPVPIFPPGKGFLLPPSFEFKDIPRKIRKGKPQPQAPKYKPSLWGIGAVPGAPKLTITKIPKFVSGGGIRGMLEPKKGKKKKKKKKEEKLWWFA